MLIHVLSLVMPPHGGRAEVPTQQGEGQDLCVSATPSGWHSVENLRRLAEMLPSIRRHYMATP